MYEEGMQMRPILFPPCVFFNDRYHNRLRSMVRVFYLIEREKNWFGFISISVVACVVRVISPGSGRGGNLWKLVDLDNLRSRLENVRVKDRKR